MRPGHARKQSRRQAKIVVTGVVVAITHDLGQARGRSADKAQRSKHSCVMHAAARRGHPVHLDPVDVFLGADCVAVGGREEANLMSKFDHLSGHGHRGEGSAAAHGRKFVVNEE